jgi:uncharacterized membrane protein SpoIIM required for sporulation
MREKTFIEQNSATWQEYAQLLKSRQEIYPAQIAQMMQLISDHLAYARTFFPDSKTTKYLNSLAAAISRRIYVRKKESYGRILAFWTNELPSSFRISQGKLLFSAFFFLINVFIGIISAAGDSEYINLILGETYVQQTRENISRGDPMAVYKSMHQLDMMGYITVNNVRVAFTAFAGGILCGAGTLWILCTNGFMLGAFQYMFYQQGLLAESALVIWIHGTLEISAIIIAGAAGLELAAGFMFPGTYTRIEGLQRGARQGLRIIIGIVPVFIMAAFLESFITRYTHMPAIVSLLIIASSLAFIIWYFIILPRRTGRAEFSGI